MATAGAANLIIGLGVDEAEMIPATWDYRSSVLIVAGYLPDRRGPAYLPGATILDIQLPTAISLLADSHREYDWPAGVGQAVRTQAALHLSEAAKARPGFLSPVQVVRPARSHAPRDTVVTADAGAQLDRIWVKYVGNEPPYALRDPSINDRRVLFEMGVVKVATFGRP